MSTDKPLHVQVAEALGWTNVVLAPATPFEPLWIGKPPPGLSYRWVSEVDHEQRSITIRSDVGSIPRYDTDWSATGPLIDRYRISLRPTIQAHDDPSMLASWDAYLRNPPPSVLEPHVCLRADFFVVGTTPLVAVCHLILKLP